MIKVMNEINQKDSVKCFDFSGKVIEPENEYNKMLSLNEYIKFN